jgi:DNA replication protein DnaC
VEKIDDRIPRGLNQAALLRLSNSDWLAHRQNVIISGPTGSGKSFLACALAHKACRDGYSALYLRLSRLLEEMALCRADGSYGKRLQKLAGCQLLVLDDRGLSPLKDSVRKMKSKVD